MESRSRLKWPSEIPQRFPFWTYLVVTAFMMDLLVEDFVSAVEVTSIVETAEEWRVNTVVRITPVLETVKIDLKVA